MKRINSQTIRVIILAGILTLSVAGLAAAQGSGKNLGKGKMGRRGAGPQGDPARRVEMLAQRLDLSDEQVEAITAIHEKAREDGVELRKELLRLRNEMKGEMLEDSPSEKTVLELNEKMGALKTELKANRLKARLAVRNELTPEQRDKMLIMGEGGRHGRKGHGRMGSGCTGPGCMGPDHMRGGRPGRGACGPEDFGPRGGRFWNAGNDDGVEE